MPSADDLLAEEAADPTTPGERLAELAGRAATYANYAATIARANPNLPEQALVEFLEAGDRNAWMNPSAPFALLTHMGEWKMYRGACRAVAYESNDLPRWKRAETPKVLEATQPVVEQGWESLRLHELLFFPAVCASAHRSQGSTRRADDNPMHAKLVEMALVVARSLQRQGGELLQQEPADILPSVEAWVRTQSGEQWRLVSQLRREVDERMWGERESEPERALVAWRMTLEALGGLVVQTDHESRAATFANVASYAWRDIEAARTGQASDDGQGALALAAELRRSYPTPPWP